MNDVSAGFDWITPRRVSHGVVFSTRVLISRQAVEDTCHDDDAVWHPKLRRLRTCCLLAFVLLAFLSQPVIAQSTPPWHAAGWSNRAIVSVEPSGEEITDVASIHLVHAGLLAPNADDIRIFDASGRPTPYEVTYLDPARDAYISFRCAPSRGVKQIFFVYYGNNAAPVDPVRALASAYGHGAPKPGPDAGGWIPRAGLVYTTLQRSGAPNPDTFDQMLALIAASPGPMGADYHANISDSFNPYGPSSNFISVYRGWIQIPEDGDHSFCTDSNESSFSFIDGSVLVHWPGQHTAKHGRRGEFNTTRHLAAGPHYIEYFHENADQTTVAFLGYERPGDHQFRGVTGDYFRSANPGHVVRYEEAPGNQTLVPRVVMNDSVWTEEKSPSQYARFGFSADPGMDVLDLPKWKVHWEFGDGASADGPASQHIYSTIRVYPATMTATSPAGQTVVRKWPVNVFRVDEIAGPFRTGDVKTYASVVATYDATRLASRDLAEASKLLAGGGQSAAASAFAKVVLTRADASSEDQARAHLILGTMPDPKSAGVDGSVARENARQLEEAYRSESDPMKKMELSTLLIKTLGLELGDVDQAQKTFDRAAELAKQTGLGRKTDRKLLKACRDATLMMGDVMLNANQTDKAADLYKTCEELNGTTIPPGVRASKIGAYSEAIDQQIEHHNFADAREVIRRWKDELPSDQIRGTLAFYEGKIAYLSNQPADAIRPLKLAVTLAIGADFEPEARYLQAQAQKATGDLDGYKRTLRGLVNAGLTGPFRDKAAAELGVK